MYIGEHIEIILNNPVEMFTAGLHVDQGEGFIMEDNGNLVPDDENVHYRCILGFLIFSIIIYWSNEKD